VGLVDGVVEAVTCWSGEVSGHLPLADPDLVVVIAADEPSTEDERRDRERDAARARGVNAYARTGCGSTYGAGRSGHRMRSAIAMSWRWPSGPTMECWRY
jgi:hypothetical protein